MGPKKILVVEDNKLIAQVFAAKLEAAGFAVKVAANGKEAVELLAGEPFDLASLDLIMPEMNGFTVLEEMKKRKIAVPVIVFSSLGQPGDEEKALALGAKKYIAKSNTPIDDIQSIIEYAKHIDNPVP